MWSSGDAVVLRDIWFGEVWRAVPAVVVVDASEATAVFIPLGCESVYPADGDGREIRLPTRGVARASRRTSERALVLVQPQSAWSLWHFFRDDGAFDRWYVNFERPLGRGAVTLDYVDHKLDLIARPDGSLTWKDEDELEEAAALGLLDPAAVRRDAERLLERPPWPTGWEDFRADPAWPVPELPPGWDEVV
jgi:uncharacterized protein